MTDEERAELEVLRAREAEMEAHFSEQSERMARSEREAQAQQAVTAQMRAEWEAMKAEVRAPFRVQHTRAAASHGKQAALRFDLVLWNASTSQSAAPTARFGVKTAENESSHIARRRGIHL